MLCERVTVALYFTSSGRKQKETRKKEKREREKEQEEDLLV